jgi:hypothetical protein
MLVYCYGEKSYLTFMKNEDKDGIYLCFTLSIKFKSYNLFYNDMIFII